MSPSICRDDQYGPVKVFARENRISSFDPESNAYLLLEECLDAKYDKVGDYGIFTTKYFKVKGVPFGGGKFDSIWSVKNPRTTDPRFDLIFTTRTLNDYINYLSAISVYNDDLQNIFLKPFSVDVSTSEFPNAFYSDGSYSLTFGMVKNLCSFGGDGDAILHEFDHLLTNTRHRDLARMLNDTEGLAMHETLSDVGPAIYFDDPQLAETTVICLEVAKEEGPDIGLRNIAVVQPSVFYDEEGHSRTELYAPFLWFSYQELIGLMDGNKRAAQAAMTIMVHRMPEFLPSAPKREDFVRAFFHALDDLSRRPEFAARYRFDTDKFTNRILRNIVNGTIILTEAEERYATTPYPTVSNINEELNKLSGGNVTLVEGYKNGNITFYQQMVEGIPVTGCGVRFVRTLSGIKMIDMLSRETFHVADAPRVSPEAGWGAIVKSGKTYDELAALLDRQLKARVLKKKDLNTLLMGMKGLPNEKMPQFETAFIPGKVNPQYIYKPSGGVTFYVDSNDGSVSFARQSFF